MSALPSRETLISSPKYERLTKGYIPANTFYCYRDATESKPVWFHSCASSRLKIQDFTSVFFFKERLLTTKGNKIITCQT